jgi:DNA-binding MarR family transcriptional regulator
MTVDKLVGERVIEPNTAAGFDPADELRRQYDIHGWEGGLAAAASQEVVRAQAMVVARVDAELAEYDLKFARYGTLSLLFFSRHGSLPLGKISERLMLHPASVTSIVDRLERQGLVARVAHPTDRRTTLATITANGCDLIVRAHEKVSEAASGMGGLSRPELTQLVRLLTKLRTANEKRGLAE